MNTSEPITASERLAKVSNGALYSRLATARTILHYASTPYGREKAIREIEATRTELLRRGLKCG